MAEQESTLDILSALNAVGNPCTRTTGEENVDIEQVIASIVKLACVMSEKYLYEYQQEFLRRVIEAIMLHDGDMLTGLWSRQSGKTEAIADGVLACMLIMPALAKEFPNDWRFNITDDLGRYRGYKGGINFGIYAPILEQSQIMLERLRDILESDSAIEIIKELGVTITSNKGSSVRFSNGSTVLAMSASKNSKIEGHTHHVVIAEEAQDIDAQKMRKSIHPMTASTKGMIIKIGTASTQKGDFYQSIQFNRRVELTSDKRNHFFFPQTVCIQYNSLYKEYIEAEKQRIGAESDEFRMSYNCEWLLERGMFITDTSLMSKGVALTNGKHAVYSRERYTGLNIVAGIDLAKETDSTVVTVMDVDWSAPAIEETLFRNMRESSFVAYTKHIIAWKEFRGDDYEDQYHEIVEWLTHFNPLRKIVLDATREASFADRMAHTDCFAEVEVEDFVFGLQTKAVGYRLLHGDLLSKRLTFPAGDESRRSTEYRRFVVQMLDLVKSYSGDYLVVSHPDETGAHDDYPDSAMLANWGANVPTADLSIEQFSANAFM